MNVKPLFWIDDAGDRHVARNMRELPLLLQLGITRMVTRIALSPAVRRKGKQATKGQPEQVHAHAIEAMNILLCVLLPRLPHDEIDQHPYSEKRHFVMRWCAHQHIPFVAST